MENRPGYFRFNRADERSRMIEGIVAEGVRDEKVLSALSRVPRHLFVPDSVTNRAYDPVPLPIGYNQTISSPFIVASMSELLRIKTGDKILEIGTGCGYQTAVLLEMGTLVCSIEIVPEVAELGAANLAKLGYKPSLRVGDGYYGWIEQAPFDGCIIAATAPNIPPKLIPQMKRGGRIVLPIRDSTGSETLIRATISAKKPDIERFYNVIFVPMTGKVLWPDS